MHQAHADVTQQAQVEPIRAVQAAKPLHRAQHQRVFPASTPLVACQHVQIAGSGATTQGATKLFGQYPHVGESEVDALPGQRMDHVRGIADQHDARGNIRVGMLLAQRKIVAPGYLAYATETTLAGALQLQRERAIVERQQLLCPSIVRAPHDRAGVISLQRRR